MYFNEAQIQRIINQFPLEVRGKYDAVVLKEPTPRKDTCEKAKEVLRIAIGADTFIKCENNILNIRCSLEDFGYYGRLSEPQFYDALKEIEDELSHTLGNIVEATIEVENFEVEPDPIPPLYFGELEKVTIYNLTIKIYLDSSL